MRIGSFLAACALLSSMAACKPRTYGGQTESASETAVAEKEILRCEVRKENAGDLPGTFDVWDVSVKVKQNSLSIFYKSEKRGQQSIVYQREAQKDTGNDDTRYVFHVKPTAELLGGGGPRITEVDNDVKHNTSIGEYFNNLSPSMVILTARKDDQFQLIKANFGVQYHNVNKNNTPEVFSDVYTNCIPGTIKKFGY
jgi:hypothetical protein